jgi:putative N6-adenine-specific DNA methylase
MVGPLAAKLKMNDSLSIGVVCTPGLEGVTVRELERLGIPRPAPESVRAEAGLIEVSGDLVRVGELNLHLRTASRVLVRLAPFNAAAFSELRKKASRLPWSHFLQPGQPVSVRVSTHASKLYHKKGIAERLAGAISDRMGKESPLVAAADEDAGGAQLIIVRLLRDHCTVSIDSSGEHLHRRGYRQETAKAPLRENLAAALLMMSGWPGDVPLVDPFCGAGTIPIEAALMAAGIPPGWNRKFAFEQWPLLDAGTWSSVRARAQESRVAPRAVIQGSDRDAGAIKASQANAARAGVGEMITWSCHSISDLTLPGKPGWMVTNPPYGERVKGGPDLRNLYARIGSIWRERAVLWHTFLVTSSAQWSGQLGSPCETLAQFNNGGLLVRFLRVHAGEAKKESGS